MKDAIRTVMAAALLALFLGAVTVAVFVGRGWTPENTNTAITALAVACGGGLAVFAGVFGVFLGIAALRRMAAPPEPPRPTLPALPVWRETRPPLPALPAGQWLGGGPDVYDVWPDAIDVTPNQPAQPALPRFYREI